MAQANVSVVIDAIDRATPNIQRTDMSLRRLGTSLGQTATLATTLGAATGVMDARLLRLVGTASLLLSSLSSLNPVMIGLTALVIAGSIAWKHYHQEMSETEKAVDKFNQKSAEMAEGLRQINISRGQLANPGGAIALTAGKTKVQLEAEANAMERQAKAAELSNTLAKIRSNLLVADMKGEGLGDVEDFMNVGLSGMTVAQMAEQAAVAIEKAADAKEKADKEAEESLRRLNKMQNEQVDILALNFAEVNDILRAERERVRVMEEQRQIADDILMIQANIAHTVAEWTRLLLGNRNAGLGQSMASKVQDYNLTASMFGFLPGSGGFPFPTFDEKGVPIFPSIGVDPFGNYTIEVFLDGQQVGAAIGAGATRNEQTRSS